MDSAAYAACGAAPMRWRTQSPQSRAPRASPSPAAGRKAAPAARRQRWWRILARPGAKRARPAGAVQAAAGAASAQLAQQWPAALRVPLAAVAEPATGTLREYRRAPRAALATIVEGNESAAA